jgi:UDP-N-acetylmuramoylalanine--D-glutamate ligase
MDKNIFKNKKVLIMGLGLNGGGVGAAKFFAKQCANVLVTDLKTKEQLSESVAKLKAFPKIKFTLGGHREADFISTDLIIKNPDVPSSSPYLEIARKNNIAIETDISLFFKLSDAFIIGVTGTKGKSTTASLICHILKSKYKRTFLAGNIGISSFELLPKIKKGDKVILELSSFELEDLSQSPNVAVITNIFPDHLNRYASMAEYIDAKKRIFKFQNKNDILILNGDDPVVREFAKEAKSKVIFSSGQLAVETAKFLGVPEKLIEKSVKNFKGVKSRQEFVGEISGVKYFNDTTATMPEAVIYAINTFAEKFPRAKLIFISGGVDKGLNYTELSDEIKEKVSQLVMLPGTASDKIKDGLKDYKNLYEVFSMKEAVKKAKQLAGKGDLVVLSPGGSSFNLFKNEFDRGNQFVKAVKELR